MFDESIDATGCVCDEGWQGQGCTIPIAPDASAPTSDPLGSNADPAPSTSDKGGMVALWVCVVIVLVLALIIFVYFYRRSRRTAQYGSEDNPIALKARTDMNWDGIDEIQQGASFTRGDYGQPATLETKNLGVEEAATEMIVSKQEQIEALESKLRMTEDQKSAPYKDEFRVIPKKKVTATFRAANADENRRKNRYKDIHPYDDTRVKLVSEDNDYINANHLSMNAANKTFWFIAAQGPLPHTCGDFWQMTWEQGSRMIVMVAAETENGMVKCEKYWPEVEGDAGALTFGDFRVTLTRIAANEAYAIRGIRLRNLKTNEKRTVWQLQYTSWPDHGVPRSCSAFLAFVDEVRSVRTRLMGEVEQPLWPTLAHCSAGIGRTGVLIMIELCLAKLEHGLLPDLGAMLSELREQRPSLVQTVDQYRFCYQALLQALR